MAGVNYSIRTYCAAPRPVVLVGRTHTHRRFWQTVQNGETWTRQFASASNPL
jgi:hypothetical protein